MRHRAMPSRIHNDVDKGWAWVVLAASFMSLVILATVPISVGMFQVEFLDHFSGSTAYTSLVCSMCTALQHLMAPVASVLCNVFSIRTAAMFGSLILSLGFLAASFAVNLQQLLIFYGITAGVGFGIVFTPCAIAVGHYFDRHRVWVNAIALASVGIGVLSGPHLIGWMIERFGWRLALAYYGCITIQICVLCSLLYPTQSVSQKRTCCRKQKRELDENLIHRKKWANKLPLRVLKEKPLWLLSVSYHLVSTGFAINIVHFPSYVKSIGVPLHRIPVMFTAYGLTMAITRVLGGLFCNTKNIDVNVVHFGCHCCLGVTVLLMPLYARSFATLVLYQILFASYFGLIFMLFTPIVVELFGVKNLASCFGLIMLSAGFGYFSGPPIAGWLYDTTSSYSAGFHIGGAVILCGGFLLLLIPIFRVKPNLSPMETDPAEGDVDIIVEESQTTC